MSNDDLGLIKKAVIQIGAGGSAGFVEVCAMHPMDIIKTRLQLQVKTDKVNALYYTGIRDCMTKMYHNEGLGAFWKGILPPIVAETPKRALKFFTFEQYKQLFSSGSNLPLPVILALAGFCAGITEGIVVNPFEVVKENNPGKWPGGLNRGLSATALRNGIFNCCYFGFYHSVKGFIPVNKDPWIEFFTKVGLGFTAGTLASCLNIPFDVAKSRIQGPQDNIQYKGTFKTLKIVYQNEGLTALYKGLVPKILRLGPGGAIMLVVYDYMHSFLTFKFQSQLIN